MPKILLSDQNSKQNFLQMKSTKKESKREMRTFFAIWMEKDWFDEKGKRFWICMFTVQVVKNLAVQKKLPNILSQILISNVIGK